jgi:hypothetical protein
LPRGRREQDLLTRPGEHPDAHRSRGWYAGRTTRTSGQAPPGARLDAARKNGCCAGRKNPVLCTDQSQLRWPARGERSQDRLSAAAGRSRYPGARGWGRSARLLAAIHVTPGDMGSLFGLLPAFGGALMASWRPAGPTSPRRPPCPRRPTWLTTSISWSSRSGQAARRAPDDRPPGRADRRAALRAEAGTGGA